MSAREGSLWDGVMPNKHRGDSARFYTVMQNLRHSYATLLLSEDANVKFVSQQLGHASTKMTSDRYFHLVKEHNIKEHNAVVADGMQEVSDDVLRCAKSGQSEKRAAPPNAKNSVIDASRALSSVG